MLHRPIRWSRAGLCGMFVLVLLGVMSACSPHPELLSNSLTQSNGLESGNHVGKSFTFNMIPSPGIKACLPKARGEVTITPGAVNQQLQLEVRGLAPHTGFAFFVIEVPNKPFGISWYQSDLETDGNGAASITVRGIFDVETFSVSLGGSTTTFAPTHQYHLGLWFGDPADPFKLGCEPGAKAPIVTPFDGDQNAGIQVLNTANFPDNAGPLSKVHP